MRPAFLHAVLAAVGLAAVAAPAWVVSHPPAILRALPVRAKLPPRRVVAQTELPPVEPVALVELAPDDARAFNETVPFVSGPNPAARPFRFIGSAEERDRARDCLAAAVIYEAGDDAVGERAVAQVVLNRLRHPAFPKTVCGVVFEGQERTRGCQFTFTCDGALTRWHPSEAGWRRAREVAERALTGGVFRPVGWATHYHTDWVVPYWQSSLDKLARVGTHLFFRWTGWWGTPPAFNRARAGVEPGIARLAGLSDAHRMGDAMDEAVGALAEAEVLTAATAAAEPLQPVEGNIFLVTLPAAIPAEGWPAFALAACGDRPVCRVSAWRDRARTPTALPLAADQIAAMSFSYLRDRSVGFERALWNCQEVERPAPQCMKRQVLLTGAPPRPTPTPTPTAAPTPPPRGPGDLGGLRRAPGAAIPDAPAARPSPVPERPRVTPPGTRPAPGP